MNSITKLFLADLKAVLEKHGVEIACDDLYDGTDAYCGTEVRFVTGHFDPENMDAERIDFSAKELQRLL